MFSSIFDRFRKPEGKDLDPDSTLFQLITQIDEIREEMRELIQKTDPNVEVCPGWTIKEVLRHITAWENVIHKGILAFRDGEPPYFIHNQDFDLFNQEAVDYRAKWTLEEVIQEWEQVRLELRSTIQGLEESLLFEEMVLPWGSERTLQELIEIVAEHEAEHKDGICKHVFKR